MQQLIDGLLDPRAVEHTGAGGYDSFHGRLRHDLRTPMNAIKGYGEMLLDDALEARADAFVRDLETAILTHKPCTRPLSNTNGSRAIQHYFCARSCRRSRFLEFVWNSCPQIY